MSLRERYSAAPLAGEGMGKADPAAWLLQRLLRGFDFGHLTVRLPSGRLVRKAGALPGPEAVLELRRWRGLRRVVTGGALGLAEGYVAGDWTSPDLPSLIELLALNIDGIEAARPASPLSRWTARLRHRANANSRKGSRRNISFHYDLGNAFYAAWLDSGMQYSSAIYAEGDDLERAQTRKLERIADWLALSGGESVLEIGIGWGALAEHLAARHGADITGVTLSERQLAYATSRLGAAGLDADLRLQDYREIPGQYDRIVSIEMIEAVGEAYWPNYFGVLRDRLVPGGRAVIQAITIDAARFEPYRRQPDFIQLHIFPGGMLPTKEAVQQQAEAAGLTLSRVESFGSSYAATLAEWRKRFHARWAEIERLGFDDRFRRLWDYYLAYCEGGFRAGQLDVSLFELRR